MNAINRALVILFLIVLIALSAGILLLTLGVVRPAQLGVAPWAQEGLSTFQRLDSISELWTLIGWGAVFLLSLVLLVLEFSTLQRRESSLLLSRSDAGTVTVANKGVRQLVDREAQRVNGVLEARSHVKEGSSGNLRIHCRTSIDPGASVPDLTNDLQERLRRVVEHHLGRSVEDVRIDTQLAPLDDPKRRKRRVR